MCAYNITPCKIFYSIHTNKFILVWDFMRITFEVAGISQQIDMSPHPNYNNGSI